MVGEPLADTHTDTQAKFMLQDILFLLVALFDVTNDLNFYVCGETLKPLLL